jgi:RND family efflux transporter MFP subunit
LLAAAARATAAGQEAVDGFTEPFRKIELAPAEPGILTQILVEEGAAVEAGQVLATLDNEVLQVALKIAKQILDSRGKLEGARAERDVRFDRLKRLKSLQPQGFAFREELERAAADLAVAEANVLAAEEQKFLDSLEHQKAQAMLERRIIRSPVNGVITKVHHEQQEYVAGSTPTVFTVVQLNPLRVVFAVPASTARRLKAQQVVGVRFPETGNESAGRIELISPITDAESGLVRVKVLIANPAGTHPCGARCLLLPGTSAVESP